MLEVEFAMSWQACSPSANRIGYARVSSQGQNLDSQMDALREAGCEKIFTDRMTGSRLDRPGWEQMMAYLRPGEPPKLKTPPPASTASSRSRSPARVRPRARDEIDRQASRRAGFSSYGSAARSHRLR